MYPFTGKKILSRVVGELPEASVPRVEKFLVAIAIGEWKPFCSLFLQVLTKEIRKKLKKYPLVGHIWERGTAITAGGT